MDKSDRAVELLDRMGRIVHGLQFALGLNPAQWEALRFLARANCYSRSPTALAEFLGTTKGTASQTLIALESKGMVKRTRRATDRRSVEIEVTPLGLELIEKDPLSSVFDAASRLGPDQCEAMNAALDQVVANLQQSIGFSETGRCLDCVHFCNETAKPESDATCRCALAQEEMAPQELQRICTNFEPVA
jgi:DNA-binding MarR family transcriptional regulator